MAFGTDQILLWSFTTGFDFTCGVLAASAAIDWLAERAGWRSRAR